MKTWMILTMAVLVLGGRIWADDAPAPEAGDPILRGDSLVQKKAEYKFRPGQKMELKDDMLTYWGEKPTDVQLVEFLPDTLSRLTSPWFAVRSYLGYAKVTPGSYLEMVLTYAPEQPGGAEQVFTVKAQAPSGPMASLAGDADPQELVLPYDASAMKTHLERLVVNLHLTGGYGTTFIMRDAEIFQYINAASLKGASEGKQAGTFLEIRLTAGPNGTVYSVPGTPLIAGPDSSRSRSNATGRT